MFHANLLDPILASPFEGPLVRPSYRGQGIANIGATILSSYGIKVERPVLRKEIAAHPAWKRDIKVFFLADGFGLNDFERHGALPFLETLSERADIFPLTSVYPSTTSAALTALHTGLTPQEHGIPEWNLYAEEFDVFIQSIPFKPWESSKVDSLLDRGATPEYLYAGTTVYQQLQDAGMSSFVFVEERLSGSVYSNLMNTGATVVTFNEVEELTEKLAAGIEGQTGPAYFFVYWDRIDGTAHNAGPGSDGHAAAVRYFFDIVEDFVKTSIPFADRVAFMLSADHGHASIDPDSMIFLNELLPEDTWRLSKTGKIITPMGSPHDPILYVKPERQEATEIFLRAELRGKATVMSSRDALATGLFGINAPLPVFERRMGDLLVLPHPGNSVWYDYGQFTMRGMHGGMSQTEMAVPLILAELDSLVRSAKP